MALPCTLGALHAGARVSHRRGTLYWRARVLGPLTCWNQVRPWWRLRLLKLAQQVQYLSYYGLGHKALSEDKMPYALYLGNHAMCWCSASLTCMSRQLLAAAHLSAC